MSKTIEAEKILMDKPEKRSGSWPWPILLCTVVFVVCVLFMTTPLMRVGHVLEKADIALPPGFTPPAMPFLTFWSGWLPANLHLSLSDPASSLYRTGDIEILLLVALSSIVYGVAILFCSRRMQDGQVRFVRSAIWIGTIIAGLIFVLTPGMASKDLFVYADYGNLLGQHGANPYFSVPSTTSHNDILTILDGWSTAPSAYGPVWVLLTGLFSVIFGQAPLHFYYAYRALGLACHIINVLLIMQILRVSGRSARTITLGMLLYAWNPLALFESALGAHNDVFMGTLILLGLLLCFTAYQKGFTQLRNYWPGLVVLTLAILVKFTTIPVIIFFLMLLAAKTLGLPETPVRSLRWGPAIKNVIIAGAIFVLVSLAFYLPFWVGHSVGSIVHSFGAPPSSSGAENSLMRVATQWQLAYGHHAKGSLLYYPTYILGSHSLWSAVDILALAASFVIGAWFTWRSPTLRTFVIGSLASLTVLLLVTPWFYSWYLTWLVVLAPVVLAFPMGRGAKNLVIFCLAFALLGFTTYIQTALLSHNEVLQVAIRYLLMIVPLIVLVVVLYLRSRAQAGQPVTDATSISLPSNAQEG